MTGIVGGMIGFVGGVSGWLGEAVAGLVREWPVWWGVTGFVGE